MPAVKQRPVLKLNRSPVDVLLEIVAGAGFVWMLGIVLFSWSSLPESIPTHFGAGGKPDAWGSQWTILILPAIGVALYAGLTILSRYPHRYNYPWQITHDNAERQYRMARAFLTVLKAEIVWFFGYMKMQTVEVAYGRSDGLGPEFLPMFLFSTFATIGLYFFVSHRVR
jgi:uncharacterized membrane protein